MEGVPKNGNSETTKQNDSEYTTTRVRQARQDGDVRTQETFKTNRIDGDITVIEVFYHNNDYDEALKWAEDFFKLQPGEGVFVALPDGGGFKRRRGNGGALLGKSAIETTELRKGGTAP